MDVKMWNVDDVKPYEQNQPNDDAVDAVVASIREFGFRQPIVVDAEGVIIVGHTRWKAAKKMGMLRVPVHVAGDLPPEKAKAYRIADNQTASLSEWDEDKLSAELLGLKELDYDMALLGFGPEVWKPVMGYESHYEISSHGRLRRVSTCPAAPAGYVIKPQVNNRGYTFYFLSKNRQRHASTAQRLMAVAFLGPPAEPTMHAAHKDGNRGHNHIANIQWETASENEGDKVRHGTSQRGRGNPQAKLTAQTVQQMRREAASGTHFKALAAKYGVGKITAYFAIHGITWKHICDPPPIPRCKCLVGS